MEGMDPDRRLLFWLRIPYAVDVALALVGIGFLLAGRDVGWWVLVFAAGRAVIGTVALFWIAPRVIASRTAARASESDHDDERP
jgi:hypothetical protein